MTTTCRWPRVAHPQLAAAQAVTRRLETRASSLAPQYFSLAARTTRIVQLCGTPTVAEAPTQQPGQPLRFGGLRPLPLRKTVPGVSTRPTSSARSLFMAGTSSQLFWSLFRPFAMKTLTRIGSSPPRRLGVIVVAPALVGSYFTQRNMTGIWFAVVAGLAEATTNATRPILMFLLALTIALLALPLFLHAEEREEAADVGGAGCREPTGGERRGVRLAPPRRKQPLIGRRRSLSARSERNRGTAT